VDTFDIEEKIKLRKIKACSNYKEKYKSNPKKYKKRIYNIRYNGWGSSLKEKHAIWKEQNERCAICGKKIPMLESPFDHDHLTNHVRGVLCDNCNKGLGNFRDNPEYLINAVFYLKKFNSF